MKILALNGLLGYGYSQEALRAAFADPPDYVGVDGGSTDPGPYYLGSGTSFTDRLAVKRDLALALPLALRANAPFIIGTAGGAGSRVHVQGLREILDEIAREQDLTLRLAVIYTDVDHDYVRQKLRAGKIQPMGRLELTEQSLQGTGRIVSQIGAQPIMEALRAGAQVVLTGRACDTAIYAAPCLLHGYDAGLAFHMAKIMECGALCAVPAAAADGMLAHMAAHWFELTPISPERRCTIASVAAHTLYEQADPYTIVEPDGVVDVSRSSYEQVSERTVRVSGSRFTPAAQPTLKLEGAAHAGYRALAIAGIKEPETIARVDEVFAGAHAFVRANLAGKISQSDYTLSLRKYGTALLAPYRADPPTHDLGIVIDVVGRTQSIADTVCALMRARMLHYDYPGRKSTAGNLAFPYSPSDLHAGSVYTFSIYHLAQVDDLSETARIVYDTVGGAP